EARDELLRLGEGTVCHGLLPFRELHARALRARVEPLGREHHASFHELFVELPHLGQDLLVREDARLAVLVGLDYDHESHVVSPLSRNPAAEWPRPPDPGSCLHVERGAERSTGQKLAKYQYSPGAREAMTQTGSQRSCASNLPGENMTRGLWLAGALCLVLGATEMAAQPARVIP